MKMNSSILGMTILIILLAMPKALAQDVTIKEETMSLPTYGFGKPNPVPILAENPKIFPYNKFEKYEQEPKQKDWKVVTLENDYIKVLILPEIGGKIWGAIEKSTGEEFLYKNEVVKFRNIAMRGPWTSGGIEFNFGIIGHHPSTATPVDYFTRTNADCSVSCIVGNTDLPSKTNWTVEIRLEKDKAYFETNASWYNASPLTESYYNWMTAAAVATNDLEFFIPGNKYVGHNGDAHSWPIDEEGRNLAMYKNNAFGPAKSYHVVGEYNDFFGGYYHDKNFGYGQWAPYEEMPGQKLWLWALSRSGGIWEDLLTDTDGQYIEFQAGRLFDQYSGGAVNPISQVGFDPYVMDTWSEIWFPYKEIGGMEDASRHGVLNVEFQNGQMEIGLNALQQLNQELQVKVNGEISLSEKLNLKPMEVFSKKLPTVSTDKIEISVIGTELEYSNDMESKQIKRPFYPDENLKVSEPEQLYQNGLEALEYREYQLAHSKLSALVELDPSHRDGHLALAELEYRKTNYDKALELANTVLKMDTYNSKANYLAGITYRAIEDYLNALESLGWAARDIKYRSVAYAQMAEIHLSDKSYERARTYAGKSLTYNLNNVNAREVLLVLSRIRNDQEGFKDYADGILEIDPLNHFVSSETSRIKSFEKSADSLVVQKMQNEFKSETVLNLAIRYHELGFDEEALLTLLSGPTTVKNRLWAAYLQSDSDSLQSKRLLNEALSGKVDFVFPYRRETIPVMQWAAGQNEDWKLKHHLAQNYFSVGLQEEGERILKELGNTPDSDIFYRFRAGIIKDTSFEEREKDYSKAMELKPSDWKVWEENILFQLQNEKYDEAYALSKKAFKKYRGNYNIELAHAKTSLNTGRFSDVLKVMKNIEVLPYEHASESRKIYERAHLGVARELLAKKKYSAAASILEKSKEWPENIGVGKPYGPDERMQDYLLAASYEGSGEVSKKEELLQSIVYYTSEHITNSDVDHLFGLLALKKQDKQDELTALISKLENANPKNQMALSLFKNNMEEASALKEKNNIPEDVWEGLLAALKY